MDIIDRINALLREQKKTGAQMSRELGLSSGTYSQWNTKRTRPSKAALAAIASYLGTTVEYLTDGIYRKEVIGQIQTNNRRTEIKKAIDSMSEDDLNRLEDIIKYVTGSKPEDK